MSKQTKPTTQHEVEELKILLEQKNRELEIEAALERVRARSMAMHRSDELQEVVGEVYKQLSALELSMSAVQIEEIRDDRKAMYVWVANNKAPYGSRFKIEHLGFKLLKDYISARDGGKSEFYGSMSKRSKDKFYQKAFEISELKNIPKKRKLEMLAGNGLGIYIAIKKHTALHILNFERITYTPSEQKIVQRFAEVFEQAYTRFLDLKKAEAQAREAQIEAALERVRAKSMAMHSSEELTDTVYQLFKELDSLKINLLRCGVARVFESKKVELYTFSKDQKGNPVPVLGNAMLEGHPVLDACYQGWKNGQEYHGTIEGKSLKSYYETIAANFKLPVKYKNVKHYGYWFFFPEGCLYTVTEIPLTDGELDIYRKFNAVVSLTYRRYIDLMTAEAQAREAQIEAGIERVRAKSMAMHHTSELLDTAAELFQQLEELGIKPWRCGLAILNEDETKFEFWSETTTPKGRSVSINGSADTSGHVHVKGALHAIKTNEDFYIYDLTGQDLIDYIQFITKDFNLPEASQNAAELPERLVYYCSIFSRGVLYGAFLSTIENSDKQILKRFAKVFEQTYTRFLDLQKAEAQAREAEIELALERVRAKTMAMQKSEELRELVFEYYKQIHPFGFAKWGFEIKIAKEDKSGFYCWISPPGARVQPEGFNIPTLNHWVLKKYWSAYEQQIPITTIVNSGADKRRLAVLLLEKSDMKNLPEDVKTNIMDTEYVHFTVAAMRFGLLKAVDMEPVPQKDYSILQRFAKVFEQTYTRFLDLQKAEAQAREAQIEAALERVRSRSMGMQKSDELKEVIACVFEQLQVLDFVVPACSLIFYQEDMSAQHWFAGFSHDVYPESYTIPFIDLPYYTDMLQAWKDQREYGEFIMKGKAKVDYAKWLLSESDFKNLPGEFVEQSGMLTPAPMYFADAFNKYGMLEVIGNESMPEEKVEVLKRISKVFEQTYTRFLDLQKAEAQAREAQIEAALERVRSRSMAMHKSEELNEVATVLFQQIRQMGGNLWTCGIVLCQKDSKVDHFMVALENGMAPTIEIPNTKDPATKNMYHYWEKGADYYVEEAGGKDLEKHYDYLETLPTMKPVIENLKASGISFPTWQKWHAAYFTHGYLMIITLEPYPQEEVFKRFAKVFEQAYTRFLDLQKVEAQAREAQIEAALERVRAKSLAMHQSDELQEVIHVVFKEVKKLGINADSCIININEPGNYDINMWISNQEQTYSNLVKIPYSDHPVMVDYAEARKNKIDLITNHYSKEEGYNFFSDAFKNSDLKIAPKKWQKLVLTAPSYIRSMALNEHTCIGINNYQNRPFTESENEILKRIGKVFEQTYTRFLDLQKAEAQAREAQIEASLERVRAKALAMHSTQDISDATAIVFNELTRLGVEMERCGIGIFNNPPVMELWSTPLSPKDKKVVEVITGSLNIDIHPLLRGSYEAWKSKEDFFIYELKGAGVKKYYQLLEKDPGYHFPKISSYSQTQILNTAYFMEGSIFVYTRDPLPEEHKEIIRRFTKVFSLTYRRYQDLKHAEAQAREAKIEAALERIRASAMAMHSSDGLSEVAAVLREQMAMIGQKELESCLVQLYNKGSKHYTAFYSFKMPNDPDEKMVHDVAKNVPWEKTEWSRQVITNYNSGLNHYTIHADKKMLTEWYEMLAEVSPRTVEYNEKGELIVPEELYYYFSCFSGGFLSVISYKSPSEETKELLNRAAKTFDMAFRRYLDLKKAEAQAREAQIEAAVERVRAASMAMHKSADLLDVARVIFEQLLQLGVHAHAAYIYENLSDREAFHFWTAANGKIYPEQIHVPVINNRMMIELFEALENGANFVAGQLSKREKDQLFRHIFKNSNLVTTAERQKYVFEAEGIIWSSAILKNTALTAHKYTKEHFSEEQNAIIRRLGSAFEQSYTRFLDLKKAEEQAREAQIEAALERIRSKALAMQSSADLHGVSIVLRDQMGLLGQPDLESSIVHLYNKPETLESWYTFRSTETDSDKIVTDVAIIPVDSCDYIKETLEKYHSKETEYTLVSKGKKLSDWYNVMVKVAPETIEYDDKGKMIIPKILYYHHSKFSGGALLMISNQPPSQESKELQQRAAKVFNFAYQRFLDLKKAEAQAHEAIKQASLDRVRGEIASMRTTKDLERITPLIWKELTALDVPFFRCGIFILNEETQMVHAYLSTPTGESLAALHLGFNETELGLIAPAIENWRKQKAYKEEWDRQRFIKNMQLFMKRGHISNPEKYQAGDKPPEKLVLHLVPFKQGMLYAGNSEALIPEHMQLMQELANAFSVAYSRYEDFTQLEQAKANIEKALTDLQAAQTQLVHAEKMASLGELTAGIAHEIQNPLNFVNNFSEVSKELIEEIYEEMQEGNLEEIKDITEDIKLNLDKINHHGQRASSIVKGMLEHSRTGSRDKELTDLNILADEYLRLAYHGLRAKDKSFNADFKTEFDEQLPKVKVISQDIGRVLLNLINNAFYAVSSKSTQAKNKGAIEEEGYQPQVVVSTKRRDKSIEIAVQDNGGGIPKDVLDKIFQPFFTTKPTGQGTGLGLSLSYDIVTKGHDGHLEVETEEGMGTRFVVHLPVV